MVRRNLSLIAGVLACIMIVGASTGYGAEPVLKFRTVIQKMESLRSKSDVSVESADQVTGTSGEAVIDPQEKYFHEVEGRMVEGEGVIKKIVFGRRDRTKVSILTSDSSPSKGFNAIVVTHHNEARPFKEGDRVYFKGTLERMSLIRGLSLEMRGTLTKAKKTTK